MGDHQTGCETRNPAGNQANSVITPKTPAELRDELRAIEAEWADHARATREQLGDLEERVRRFVATAQTGTSE